MTTASLLWGAVLTFGAMLAWLIHLARNDPALYRVLYAALAIPVLLIGALGLIVMFWPGPAPRAMRITGTVILVFVIALASMSQLLDHIAEMPPEKRPPPKANPPAAAQATEPLPSDPAKTPPASQPERTGPDDPDRR